MFIKLLKKLLGGVAAGLGFAVAVVAVFSLFGGMMIGEMSEDAFSESEIRVSEETGYRKFDENAGLAVKSHAERKTENRVEILAEIENSGETTWTSISVEVELFDAQDQFLDECTAYLPGRLGPGQVENVKVSCGRCKKQPLGEFATYKIRVIDASSF